MMAKSKIKGYEGSKADRREDKTGAKKAGMSEKRFEKSGQDRRDDRRDANKKGGR